MHSFIFHETKVALVIAVNQDESGNANVRVRNGGLLFARINRWGWSTIEK